LRYFSAVWHTAGARINEVVLVTCTGGNLFLSASCYGTFIPILAVVLHPFLSVVLYHLPAVKIHPNLIHNQSFTTGFEQKNIAVLFRLSHCGKIEHHQSFTKSICHHQIFPLSYGKKSLPTCGHSM
jgi:hypothetical protein